MLNNKQKLINCKNKVADWIDEYLAFLSLFLTVTPFLWFTAWLSTEVGSSPIVDLLTFVFGGGLALLGQVAIKESDKARRLQNRVNLLERALRR
ncbi:hypothetical protein RJD39_11040 [Vibrio scophthalmi]|uniref:hypothetical protein n=1 Tax=Vibrio scophthalmi TaxID=45658 RepID=UPI00387313E2